jgi:UDP-glucose 4-epimerase
MAGREEAFERLSGSLVANPDALRQYGWQPEVTSREALARLARSSSSGG